MISKDNAEKLIEKVQNSGYFVDERIHIDMLIGIINAMVEPTELKVCQNPDCKDGWVGNPYSGRFPCHYCNRNNLTCRICGKKIDPENWNLDGHCKDCYSNLYTVKGKEKPVETTEPKVCPECIRCGR